MKFYKRKKWWLDAPYLLNRKLHTHLRQIHYKLVDVCLLGGLEDLLHGDRVATVTYVLGDGRVEQNGFLGDDADVLSQPAHVQSADVAAVQ